MAKENNYLVLVQEIGFLAQAAKQFCDNCQIKSKRMKGKPDQEPLAWLALNALRFYMAMEDAFARIAKVVDESVPAGWRFAHFSVEANGCGDTWQTPRRYLDNHILPPQRLEVIPAPNDPCLSRPPGVGKNVRNYWNDVYVFSISGKGIGDFSSIPLRVCRRCRANRITDVRAGKHSFFG